jgi:hypothetical protein
VIGAIADLDADVTTIEVARSNMEVLDDLAKAGITAGQVGPGVYDIHSPQQIPDDDAIAGLIRTAADATDPRRVNPDCGLKTRTYDQVSPRSPRGADPRELAARASSLNRREMSGGGPRSACLTSLDHRAAAAASSRACRSVGASLGQEEHMSWSGAS